MSLPRSKIPSVVPLLEPTAGTRIAVPSMMAERKKKEPPKQDTPKARFAPPSQVAYSRPSPQRPQVPVMNRRRQTIWPEGGEA